jgi:RHS repeat-associated protein
MGGMPVAMVDYPDGIERVTYLHADHLNTPRYGTNQTGEVVWQWQSDAFGNGLPNEDSDGDGVSVKVNLRFPGQYYDSESGLHYNWNRYYDPAIGRYITSDPIGLEGGLNTFAYVGGNPVGFIDPNGLQAWGYNFGGGITVNNKHYSLSVAFVADTNGTSGILVTPEIGVGTPGGSLFARFLYAAGNNTFDTISGPGGSVSGSVGKVSASISFPYSHKTYCEGSTKVDVYGSHPPVFEIGAVFGKRGKPQIALTGGKSYAYGRNTVLGDIGRSISEMLFDITY